MYHSASRYVPQRIHAAAIYCSDGRMGDHFDDFLQNGLRLPRYDRVALPGGPACLAAHGAAHVEQESVMRELQFLVEVHGLSRIVLIAHAGCAFYTHRLQLSPAAVEQQQRIDLERAAQVVESIIPALAAELYLARPDDRGVSFEPIARGHDLEIGIVAQQTLRAT